MTHHTPLNTTIVVALVLAFILGAIANRFRISPIVGYLLAGVMIGPFTPGFVADQGNGLKDKQIQVLVVEEIRPRALQARADGFEAIHGNAADPQIVEAANSGAARCLLIAIPDAFEGGQVVEQARTTNPSLPIIARSHSDEETEHLTKHGASRVVMGEYEIAMTMLADVHTDAEHS